MFEFVFYLATPLLFISGIPQTLRLLKRKSSDDISIVTYSMTWMGVGLLFGKSVIVNDPVLTIANATSMITLTINLSLIFYYRGRKKYAPVESSLLHSKMEECAYCKGSGTL